MATRINGPIQTARSTNSYCYSASRTTRTGKISTKITRITTKTAHITIKSDAEFSRNCAKNYSENLQPSGC
jgi:hypothetical protein